MVETYDFKSSCTRSTERVYPQSDHIRSPDGLVKFGACRHGPPYNLPMLMVDARAVKNYGETSREPSTIEQLFYSGNYKEVIARSVDHPTPFFDETNLNWVIGALSFVGRMDDVDELMTSPFWNAMSSEQQTEARFYQAIGMCRHSCYVEAGKIFLENFRLYRRGSDKQKFFVFQGLGFFAFFKGRYKQSLHFARRAAAHALTARFNYGRAFAEDLKGHSLVQSGSVRSGLKSLRQAHQFAEIIESGGMATATKLSQKLYQAQFGILQDPVTELQNCLTECHVQNNYSEANVQLEIVQQMLLRGQRQAAEHLLNQVCGIVYESANRRQSALLNIRFATIAQLRGEFYQALNLLKCGREYINPDIDKPLLLQIEALTLDIEQRLASNGVTLEHRSHETIEALRQRTQRYINWRIAARRNPDAENSMFRRGEDPLGDLMDLTAKNPEVALPRIIASGYWGLIPRALHQSSQAAGIFIDTVPNTLIFCDRGDVHVVREGYSHAIRSFLTCLQSGPMTKEDIIVTLWGYNYHPEKHDNLVYRLVSRTRQLFDRFGGWLLSFENHYSLDPSIELRITNTLVHPPPAESEVLKPSLQEKTSDAKPARGRGQIRRQDLNTRQMQLLEQFEVTDYFDASDYISRFAVSEATARRDLSQLVSMNLLSRFGKARATKYAIN